MSLEPNSESHAGSAEELLSFDEAIKFLDTSKTTLYRLLSQDEIKGVKVGKQWRFRKADLTAYIERGPVAIAVDASALGELDSELRFFKEELRTERPDEDLAPISVEGQSAESKIVQLADGILRLAFKSNCSDIQFEPMGSVIRLRFRIDGLLHVIRQIPIRLHESLIARFKEMADMNLSEKRLPQDGRIQLQFDRTDFDIRVSTVPTAFGESAAMRILDRSAALRPLDQSGMSPANLVSLRACLDRPNGLILATGPSGSGKTLLVYSCLAELNSPGVKIVTAENLIEYQLPGTTQIQASDRIGLTLAAALRSAFRQDPDIVMCSELRDQETAKTALDAALKGVCLLSTMFANDVTSAIQRLTDMGIETYVISSALNAVVSTRWMRRLCQHCKAIANQEENRAVIANVTRHGRRAGYPVPDDAVLYEPVGCPKCRGTGFFGRISIFELLVCNPKLVGQLIQCPSQDEMLRLAIDSGMSTLLADGIRQVVSGETSIKEVLRVTDTKL